MDNFKINSMELFFSADRSHAMHVTSVLSTENPTFLIHHALEILLPILTTFTINIDFDMHIKHGEFLL